ncbi:VWA domain-containing protein [Actinomadura rubrisoli]|uniref:VWA domain-containing protein n=1 Tax=Actinomadura rubrisoli TaxID=2530368 RepID=A0A4R5C737_9ACTN|nr:VWA domain-containing protein [Actinomadura rubrisoli]TDD93933.1 VWA domain-containing protein [Actinomadura rubrisoli]
MTEIRLFARVRRGVTWGCLAAVVAVLVPVLPGRAEARVPEPTPLDLVVAVDESGSLAVKDVRAEIEAAATIVQAGLNPRTRVTVLGFGSANGTSGRAVTQYCRPTVVATAEQLQYLSNCVKGLHPRTEAEGDDTDHGAALSEALRVLRSGSPSNALKRIFLLTDGQTDISGSSSSGSGDRDAEAQRLLRQRLATARSEGVGIWPVGFGSEVDQAGLNRFAEGGAQRGCDGRAESLPRARRVRDSREVARSLVAAYAAASCLRISPPSEGDLRPAGTLELPLAVPGIASEATLTVAKGDPRVWVEFIDPNGRTAPSNGSQGRSAFTRSGAGGTIETLRVVAPLNGTWRIRLTAPGGVARQSVGAVAMYQGVIRSALVVERPQIRTGEQVTARLSLVTRGGYVQDPKELRGLSFTVTATGQALGVGRAVPMRDDGQAPDDTPGDGSYAGVFTAPGAPGKVTLTGSVAGDGLRPDGNPTATINVVARPPDVQGEVRFPGGTTVHPGGAVHGTIQFHNSTPRTIRARLLLRAPPQAQATLAQGTPLTVRPGGSSYPFEVRFGGGAALGRASATLQLADESDPAKVYLVKQRTISVEKPPGLLERHLWQILGGIALIALVLAAPWSKRHARRVRADVRSLRVALVHNGEQAGRELRPGRGKWSDEFPFIIRDIESNPLLDEPRGDKQALVARHTADGRVKVCRPDGTEFQVGFGAESEPVADGVRLVFRSVPSRYAPSGLIRLFTRGRPPKSPPIRDPKSSSPDSFKTIPSDSSDDWL